MHLQAATHFRNSLMKLMEILMSKEPSYVRCIKPNDAKQPGRFSRNFSPLKYKINLLMSETKSNLNAIQNNPHVSNSSHVSLDLIVNELIIFV